MKYILGCWIMITAMAQSIPLETKLLIEEEPTLLTTTIQVVVLTGSADDPPGKNGLTNLLSELILRGTKQRSRSQFQGDIERMGAVLFVRTTHDSIVFVGRVIRENTIPFLRLMEEALLKPAFSESEFRALKTEILADIAHAKNNNTRLAGLALRRIAFAGTALERPVDGGIESVKALTLSDVVRAYNNQFNRGNIIFGVSAPSNGDVIKKTLNEMWLKLPDGARRSPKSIQMSIPEKPTLVIIDKKDTSTGSLILGQPGITAQEPARYALTTANFSFGGEPLVSRLFKIVRGELGWTYAIGSTYHAMGNLSYQQGFFAISATPSVEFTVKSILKILAMVKEYHSTGLKTEELKLSQESLINSYPFEFESAEKRLAQKLYGYLYNVPILSPEDYAKTIGSISNNEVLASLKAKQNPNRWLITLVADSKAIQKQLDEEQKNLPEKERLTIQKVITPDMLIQ